MPVVSRPPPRQGILARLARQLLRYDTELFRTCYKGDTVKAAKLIEKGANVNFRYKGEYLCINTAMRCGHGETVKLLVEKGASINEYANYFDYRGGPQLDTYHGARLICLAVKCGELKTLKLLLERDAEVNHGPPKQGEDYWRHHDLDLLTAVIGRGNLEVINLLLSYGADVTGSGSNIPLMSAVHSFRYGIVALLIENGVNV